MVASDALQDALISAYRRADQFRGDSAVTTWLHRIVVNASLDRLRRRAVRAAQPLPDDNDALPGAVVADPVDHMDRREVQLVVTQALAERYALSGYDAAYLWLAAALKAPLATFDRRLGEAARRHLATLDDSL